MQFKNSSFKKIQGVKKERQKIKLEDVKKALRIRNILDTKRKNSLT